jgi:anti-sigma-K factor RskA
VTQSLIAVAAIVTVLSVLAARFERWHITTPMIVVLQGSPLALRQRTPSTRLSTRRSLSALPR